MLTIVGLFAPMLLRVGVRSPALQSLIVAAGIGLLALLAIGGVKAWDNARLQRHYDAGYSDAVEACKAAQLETKLANAERDRNEAQRQEAEARSRVAALTERLTKVEKENEQYEKDREKSGGVACRADDPAVIHDRKLRRRP
jgi:flagellar motility protein MotE (MotC chaperone)